MDVARREPVGLQRDVGTRAERHVERLLPAIDGDDAAPAERPQQLDGDVAEAADTDDHRGGAGPQVAQRPLDRVIRRQRGVGERGGGHRVEVADRDREAGRGEDDVLGEAAVAADAAARAAPEVAALAQVLLAAAAAGAAPAAPGAVDEHGLAELDAVGSVAERGDGPADLVSERERQLVRHGPGRPVHEMKIGVAESGGRHPEEDLTRARYGLGHVPDLGRPFPGHELNGSHACRLTSA
jgi:hypothetical protein